MKPIDDLPRPARATSEPNVIDLESQRRRRNKPSYSLADVTVVVPTLNEEQNLPYVLASIPEDVREVLIVDGYSKDRTVEVARSARRDVRVIYDERPGKGYALQTGFAESSSDIIVMIDADASMDGAEIGRYVDAISDGADFVKGSRYLPGGGSSDLTFVRRAGNKVLTGWVNVWFGTRYTDLCYGYIGFRADVLEDLRVDCGGFEVETLMNIRAKKLGLAVAEVPSFESDRLFGESNLSVWSDGLRIFKTLFRERFASSRHSSAFGQRTDPARAIDTNNATRLFGRGGRDAWTTETMYERSDRAA